MLKQGRRVAVVFCVAAVVLGVRTPAAAQGGEVRAPEPDKVRIEYRAPPECPGVEVFKGLIGSRVPVGWEAAPGEVARRVVVEVSGAAGRYAATVELADERGERGAQTVSGGLCANVVDGIALVTALAIQSPGKEAAEPGGPAVGAAAAPARPTSAPAPGATARSNPAPPAPRARAATRAPSPPRGTREPPPSRAIRAERSSAGLRVSARGALTTGVGPSAAPGAGLAIVFEPRGARLGLALHGFRTARVHARGVQVRFELLSARVEGCPFVLALANWASLEPCPFVEFGAVTGEAFEDPPTVVRGERGSSPWYSAGGAGRVVGRFDWLVVEVEALFGVPLRRERFYVERGAEVHRVPAFYGSAAAGLGVRF